MKQLQRCILVTIIVLAGVLYNGHAFQSPLVQVLHPVVSVIPSSSSTHIVVVKNHEVLLNLVVPTITDVDSSSMSSTSSVMWISEAVMTLDPTAFFTNLLSGVLNTPLILAVPIVAALGLAGLMAALIISYASPEVDE